MIWVVWWLVSGFVGFWVDAAVDRACDPVGDKRRTDASLRKGTQRGVPPWAIWAAAIVVSSVFGPPGAFWSLVIAPRQKLRSLRSGKGPMAAGQACVDWVQDTGTCHFCSFDSSVCGAEHDEECPLHGVWEAS
jgi:hypothetical protein